MKHKQVRIFKSGVLILRLRDKYLNIVTPNLKKLIVDRLNGNLVSLWESKNCIKYIIKYEKT